MTSDRKTHLSGCATEIAQPCNCPPPELATPPSGAGDAPRSMNDLPEVFGPPDFTRPLASDEAWAVWWGRPYMRLVKRPEDFKSHPVKLMWEARAGDGQRVVRVRLSPVREARDAADDEMVAALVREIDHYRDLLADAYVTIGRAVESEDGLDGSEADRFHAAVRRLWPAAVDHATVAKWLALPEEGVAPVREAASEHCAWQDPDEPLTKLWCAYEQLVVRYEALRYPNPDTEERRRILARKDDAFAHMLAFALRAARSEVSDG